MEKVRLCFTQLAEIFFGLPYLDESERVGNRWSEQGIPVTGLQVGGRDLDAIPSAAHLAVEVDAGCFSWGPDDPNGGDGPHSALEAIYIAIHDLLKEEDEEGELEAGPDSCLIRVTGVVEAGEGLEAYIQHLVAEVEVNDPADQTGPRAIILSLRYLDAA